ncbi:helix-turn-helix domain-containing protein, partial [Anaerosporobacter faecicola]|uniref:helix-turn-helix domain-containing protein n=1 Tax=Anaerosporobacter faecicola TaxID=2718714 RepID=UPI001A9A9AC4
AYSLAKKYEITHKTSIDNWVKSYQAEGDNGLLRSRQNKAYSFEYKCAIVQLYLSSELSVKDIAFQENIHNPSMITQWINRYRIAGPDALRNQKKGRKQTLDISNKKNTTVSSENITVNTSSEHVKELESELLKLRIENAFLKELRRLRLEDEAKTRDLPESSAASEDNSN